MLTAAELGLFAQALGPIAQASSLMLTAAELGLFAQFFSRMLTAAGLWFP